MQHPWRVQQQHLSEGVDDDDFDVAPGGASSSQAAPVAFGGGPLVPPLPRFGSAAVATRQVFLVLPGSRALQLRCKSPTGSGQTSVCVSGRPRR